MAVKQLKALIDDDLGGDQPDQRIAIVDDEVEQSEGVFEPLQRFGRRVMGRLEEAGQAVVDLPGVVSRTVRGEGTKEDLFTGLRALGAPFEPIFAPIGESVRLAAESFVSPETAETVGTVAEVGSAFLLPFPGRVPKPGGLATFRPDKTAKAVTSEAAKSLPGLQARYEALIDRIGQAILSKVPKVFRAGRGTPVEFRESKALLEADIANGIEKAIELGTVLKRELTAAERLRADQILRGSIITERTSERIVKAVQPVRAELDRLQQELISSGKISPETVERFQQNFGPYFARLYASKEFKETSRILSSSAPLRAGTPRLKTRGERIQVIIPDLNKTIAEVEATLGKTTFKQEFTQALKQVKREITDTKTTTKTETELIAGGLPTAPLAQGGALAKLEGIVRESLELRGMPTGEANSFIGRIKAAGSKLAEADIQKPIGEATGQKIETVTEIIKTIKETVDLDEALEVALKAFGDIASRFASKSVKIKAGGRTFSIKPILNPESATQREASLRSLLRAGFRVESREGRKATLFRDIPAETRKSPRGDPGGAWLCSGKKYLANPARDCRESVFQTSSREPRMDYGNIGSRIY